MTYHSPSSTPSIPLIDFSAFCNPDATVDEQIVVANKLLEAFKTHGFVYLENISVSPPMISEAFQWSKKFFDLPVEIKRLALHPTDGSAHRGYSPIGLEKINQDCIDRTTPTEENQEDHEEKLTAAAPDHKETFDIGPPPHLSKSKNLWLSHETEEEYNLNGIREFFEKFYMECQDLEMRILRAISIGLMGIEESEYLGKYHQESNNQIRLVHYPALQIDDLKQDVRERFGAHTDYGSITILFQDQVGGLQVKNPSKPGDFLDVKPIKNTVIVNIADLLMHWSNDTLKSTLHRVGPPPCTGPFLPARYSIPYFCGPDPRALIHSLPILNGHDLRPNKYPPIYADEYINMRINSSY
ncbi:hypothetical protein MJO28_011480 [Puccinia striiformis f. sp. tritici]|uniref:Fe2OG dioxygenase domain-containing protein n=2 Tax=Puccinia striiformis TaxID=27350 RepID=A0A2S4WJF2_9BASI|nr:hypothetical protein MJO28_011480 [Puccinia striiformis f. sp. tritici]POW21916.1 hypothetical protein PSHT_01815 [Puccinia striiformis]